MPSQLTLRAVTKSYPGRLVLDQASLTVAPGERIGIVGENGSGKSTLLRLIAGREPADGGEITVTADDGLGYLPQTVDVPSGWTVQRAVDNALADLRALERRLRELAVDLSTEDQLNAYGETLQAFEDRDGYRADARVDQALHGLGLGHLERDRPLTGLSGGEQARLSLACLLASDPGTLLLDEPTNHLDDTALAWLEDRLRRHRGTVVAVSHDRLFLDRIATAIVEVDAGAVVRFGNGYAGYLAGHATARARWEQAYQQWCAETARLREYAATTAHRVAPDRPIKDNNKVSYDRHGGRVQQSIASRVRNAEERLRRLTENPVHPPPPPLRFTAQFAGDGPADHGTSPLVQVRGVAVADRLVLDEVRVDAGDRLLVHGPNGAGKSTLLRVLAGDLRPDRGAVSRRGRIGYLRQEVPADRPRQTLLAAFAAGRAGPPDEHRDRLLSLGLFDPGSLDQPVGVLSIGQRRRLELARLVTDEFDLLLLDEPTNHLSLTLVEELEAALEDYPGAVVAVSHDRALCRRFGGRRIELRAGRLVDTPTG
ncbi:ribosomal protection-like ABC-F family protein [Plantactinospora sp. GCM10030261]|uniref:ribosomal protection-like ABC-F family protein n=1 Tax=Plantactinospora sp. GCM10030261 TaxID=3273420 RepID=UPI0036110870